MAKGTKKAEKTKEAAKEPAKTRLRVAELDLKSPGQMNLTYYFGPRRYPTPLKSPTEKAPNNA